MQSLGFALGLLQEHDQTQGLSSRANLFDWNWFGWTWLRFQGSRMQGLPGLNNGVINQEITYTSQRKFSALQVKFRCKI